MARGGTVRVARDPELRLVTFADLVRRITKHRDKATAGSSREAWEQLLALARELAETDSAEDKHLVQRRWCLTRLRVSGYQGVGETQPLEVEFPAGPGITVVYGPNGAGKSTLADAIETALHGSTSLDRKPVARNGLWNRNHTNRDAVAASVEVTLRSGDAELVLGCELDSGGDRVRGRSSLTEAGVEVTTPFPAGPWLSALTARPPVLAYAAVEREVQTTKNLREFLETLLALGGCVLTLRAAVEEHKQSTADARKRLLEALGEAKEWVEEVDETFADPDLPALDELVWPEPGADLGAWLAEAGLTEPGNVDDQITERMCQELLTAVDTAEQAVRDWAGAPDGWLSGPLRGLAEAAVNLPDPGGQCPACDSDEPHWLTHLRANVERTGSGQGRIAAFRGDLQTLRDALDVVVPPLRRVLTDAGLTLPATAAGHLAAFGQAVTTQGTDPRPDLCVAAKRLCAWLRTEECADLLARAVRHSDRLLQWRRARRAELDDLIEQWALDNELARAADQWSRANSHLTTTINVLRKEQAGLLNHRTAKRVDSLLADAGLRLTGVEVMQTKAEVTILDETDAELELGMLSAGQRNALLLAPLLATVDGGAFGFLVLDDPVHAFDEVRVDQLATVLHELAADRRIIVLTHDDRLREHITAKDPAHQTLLIERTRRDGIVSLTPVDEMWSVLLRDAEESLDMVRKAQSKTTVHVDDLLRGLCRQALDNALRTAVLCYAARTGTPVEPLLMAIDAGRTTEQRLKKAKQLLPNAGTPHVVDLAIKACKPHLNDWNGGAHGNSQSGPVTKDEIAAARLACTHLLGR
ncbi:AAA family ATPase [Crossiella sp. CA198]|uniref:AAA family ATPase n=1 Tax=Crossiella sp. CA198 TaxID=3455607 RepID=UPI003F8D72B9